MKKATKIALVGTSAAGKTTLFDALKMHYEDNQQVLFVDEVARKFFTENSDIPQSERLSYDVQVRIQDSIIEIEKQHPSSDAVITICDRSVIDPAIYVIANNDRAGGKMLIARVRQWLQTYEAFFVLNPADIPNVHDDVRWEGDELRERIHKTFIKQLETNKLPYQLISGDLKQRLDKVLTVLRNLEDQN